MGVENVIECENGNEELKMKMMKRGIGKGNEVFVK